MKSFLSAICVLALACASQASVKFNEALINPAPGADDGFEFVEILSSAPSESLAGLWLVVIEGDSAAAGVVDVALDLSAFGTTGTNKMLLVRDAATTLLPGPDPATTVGVFNFNPDIENGTNSYLLVRGFSGSVGQDLDATNDGVLDSTPWTSVDHAIAWTDTSVPGDLMYAGAVGGTDFLYPGFAPGAFSEIPGGLLTQFTVTTAVPGGPYSVFINAGTPQCANTAGTLLVPPTTWTMTPGSGNMAYSSIFAPSNATVTGGQFFGGTLASFVSSDNNKYFILNDEVDSNGIVNVTFSGVSSATAITAMVEASASRNDLTQFSQLWNVTTNAYSNFDVRVTTLSDTAFQSPILNPGNFVNTGSSEVLGRMLWIPQTDVDAADGWTESIDQFVIEVSP